MKRYVLLHFWSSYVGKSRATIGNLNHLAERYNKSTFINADGFEIIAIAVQTDKTGWQAAIKEDSLVNLTHGIAQRGYQDDVCKKFGVRSVPTGILIDQNGVVVAVNPRLAEVESYLDEAKNNKPVKKDVTGTLAQSSNKSEPIKFCRLYLFNYYGDSLQKTVTSDKGSFIFNEVKLNQDLVLKVDNKADINTSDPIALYSSQGEFMMDGRTKDQGFLFYIPSRNNHKLTQSDTNSITNYLGQIDVIKHLTFYTNGKGLTPKDEQELKPILELLQKNKIMQLELTTHTDARMDPKYATELTNNQAQAIKEFFIKKGVAVERIKTVARGNSELRKICEGGVDCREEDHQLNRRVEFLLYTN
jgi:outer membrane protein OmpA-like peptidoglycan-associated protein